MKRNRVLGDVTGLFLGAGLLAAGPAWADFGDVDTSFGNQVVPGFAIHDLGGNADSGVDMVTGLGDRLYALGVTCDAGTCLGNNELVLTRYSANGIVDTHFGASGDLVLDTNVVTDNYRLEVDDPHSRVYLATVGCDTVQCLIVVARRDFTGALDSSYGTAGVTSLPTAPNNPSVLQLLLQNNGKLLMLIEHDTINSSNVTVNTRFNIIRLNADGTPDDSWGDNGTVDVATPGGCDIGASMMLGRGPVLYVTAAKASTCAGPYTPVLRRLTGVGALDPTFGSGGEVAGNFGKTGDFIALVAQEQPNGQIAYGIGAISGQDVAIDILKLDDDGTQDTSFTAQHGTYTHDPHFFALGNAPFQSDGKLVFNGQYTATGSSDSDEGLTRIAGSPLFAHPPRFAPFVRFAQASDVVSEAAGTKTISVQLCATDAATCNLVPTAQAITIPFTLGGDATPGVDYVTTSSVTIPANASSGTITVTINDDDLEEFGESILFTLGAAASVQNTTNNNTFILGILDDDLTPTPGPPTADNGGALGLDLLAGLMGLIGLRRIRTRRR